MLKERIEHDGIVRHGLEEELGKANENCRVLYEKLKKLEEEEVETCK